MSLERGEDSDGEEQEQDKNLLTAARALSQKHGGPSDVKQVVAHVDMDAFYAQYNPYGSLETVTAAQDRRANDSNGSLIAVSYEARASGVKRVMRGDEARRVCPDLQLVQVPTAHGKADLTIYREAGSRVLSILSRWATCERASIDEAYCDLTAQAEALLLKWGQEVIDRARVSILAGSSEQKVLTREDLRMGHTGEGLAPAGAVDAWFWERPPHAWGMDERRLACGAAVMAEMRAAVAKELGYTCSAGIAPNKLLSKLCSGMNKPNKQTLVIPERIPGLLSPLPIARIKGFGGDFGERMVADLSVSTVGELCAVPLTRLEQLYGQDTAQWVWKLSHGIDEDKVQDRPLAKSIACGKTFYGRNNIRTLEEARKWIKELAGELTERLQSDARLNDRVPQLLTVSFQSQTGASVPRPTGPPTPGLKRFPNSQNLSRSCPIRLSVEAIEQRADEVREQLVEAAMGLLRKWQAQRESVQGGGAGGKGPDLRLTTLFLTAANFLSMTQTSRISDFFRSASRPAAADDKPPPTQPPPEAPPPDHQSTPEARKSPLPFRLKRPLPGAEGQEEPAPAATGDGRAKGKRAKGMERFLVPRAAQPTQQQAQEQQPQRRAAEKEQAVGEGAGATAGGASVEGRGLDAADIDPQVLAELPPDIQEEIRASMNAGTGRKGKTIDSFFARGQGAAHKPPTPKGPSRGKGTGKAKTGSLDMYFKR